MRSSFAVTTILVAVSSAAPTLFFSKADNNQVCSYAPTNLPLIQCDTEGTLLLPRVSKTFAGKGNFATCRDTCDGDLACLSYSYEAKKDECKTYWGTLAGQLFSKRATGVKFWSKTCFKKTCVPGTPSPSLPPVPPVVSSTAATSQAPSPTTVASSAVSSAAPTSPPVVPTSAAPSPTSISSAATTDAAATTSAEEPVTTAPTQTATASVTLIPSSAAACPPASTTTCSTQTAYREEYDSAKYDLQFSGTGKKLSPENPANQDPNQPPVTHTYAGSLSQCDASAQCAKDTWALGTDPFSLRYSFDLHYVKSKGWWECVSFWNPQEEMANYYTVADPEVCGVWGFSAGYR